MDYIDKKPIMDGSKICVTTCCGAMLNVDNIKKAADVRCT